MRHMVKQQVAFLRPVSEAFRLFDQDNEGKLSEEGFLSFLRNLSETRGVHLDVGDVLLKLDPSGTQVFTYSSVVSLLSMCYQLSDGEEVPVLLKLQSRGGS